MQVWRMKKEGENLMVQLKIAQIKKTMKKKLKIPQTRVHLHLQKVQKEMDQIRREGNLRNNCLRKL
ncbi:hypothetical protein SESBI_21092 [Sesbania bispinosa]|nr:hypothetical protein SESBI_21092 [Sesbania bispinosa]